MKTRIFIMAANTDEENLYNRILKRNSYATKLLGEQGHTATTWQYSAEILQDVIDFQPQIILCDLREFYPIATSRYIYEFLQKIRQAFGSNQRPKNVLVVGRDWSPVPEYEFLIDTVLQAPVMADQLLETVEGLTEPKYPGLGG